MISQNNIMLLSDTIYKIYTIDDFDEMRRELLSSLKFLVPYNIATFYLASNESPYTLFHPVGVGLPEERWQVYLDEFQDFDYTRWTFAAPTGKAYRETDLMSDEARRETPFYKKMYEPTGIHYCAILTIIRDGKFYGCITLFRRKNEADFSDDEILILDLLKEHLAYRCFKRFVKYNEDKHTHPAVEYLMDTYSLTRRETEILYLLLDGTPRDSICNKLSITLNTLKKHISNIYKKMRVSSRWELFNLLEGENSKGS